jgi:hypothetical protein
MRFLMLFAVLILTGCNSRPACDATGNAVLSDTWEFGP